MKAVNLLPSDIRGAAKPAAEAAAPGTKGGYGPFVVLGVLAAGVAGLAGYVLTANTVKQRQAQVAEVSVRQQALDRQVAQLKPYADFADATRARVKTVHDLAASRFDWEKVLGDISRVVPADVTLSNLVGDVSTDAASAGGSSSGGSSLRSAISAPAITLDGCAPGQTEVARLMARLRDVDGVTRVTLSKSDKQNVVASASGTGDTRAARNAAPCGAGARPSFELVIFFEHAPAAVQAPPAGSSTSTTPAKPTPTATPAGGSAVQGGSTP